MCTLIALHRCVPGSPLVVAANRDEFLARPAEGPALRMRENGPILAPLDVEAGGTWLGLNGRGVFVGLTNLRPEGSEGGGRVESLQRTGGPQRTDIAPGIQGSVRPGMNEPIETSPKSILAGRGTSGPIGKPGARSRGEVVMAALDARSATEAASIIAGLEADTYNPFQLFVADADRAWLTVYRDGPRTRALDPGVHVIGNVEEERMGSVLGADPRATNLEMPRRPEAIAAGDTEHPRARKLARIRERVEKLLTVRSRDLLGDLGEVCREHVDTNPFESTCVHVADRYGTRSSLLLELAEEAEASRLWATDGPPCERSFENLSALLGQLDSKSRSFGRG